VLGPGALNGEAQWEAKIDELMEAVIRLFRGLIARSTSPS